MKLVVFQCGRRKQKDFDGIVQKDFGFIAATLFFSCLPYSCVSLPAGGTFGAYPEVLNHDVAIGFRSDFGLTPEKIDITKRLTANKLEMLFIHQNEERR